MSHVYRFYIDPAESTASPIRLDGTEAHHALHVIRVKGGDAVQCFDGQGTEVEGVVTGVERAAVTVEPTSVEQAPKPRIRLTLAQAWLHREKSVEELIKRGTELGVTRFAFFRGDHSERAPKPSDKWTKWAIESCKQCGRSWLPEFTVAETLAGVFGANDSPALIATQHKQPVPLRDAVNGDSATLIVGPEGDLSEDELALAEARGARPVSLGEATLRSEVAAAALVTLTLYEMGALGPR